ncbi:MAG: hypothetical protein AVDCRST_MAG49-159 [uncultured Thermomicrobiales bacterium]|uniref:Uncharacterized protein n=1 Tax=uncultured Thermomicrobiales bacterium TaxID=1645740 RepID=A0A6J4TZ55_9BACT|nr:MAG: hypothetical protein AVDCRST_MAG49-159 [uncultured Thermomicrobiales bacterium]
MVTTVAALPALRPVRVVPPLAERRRPRARPGSRPHRRPWRAGNRSW